ncbi:MAG TPA: alanine--tRNA ligase [Bacteroidetes bacterium]|nr:alanine--tRNA ligase [Bacteroidota bacterium]
MNSTEIRDKFLRFFEEKGHKIVPSAPIVNKDDPTLMFVNAGMNQFKDYFLGNANPEYKRVADTQKCLRVSGKHNDLEEVGIDSYHHTMFEMLGNWSFGDYFKKEAIGWAWELLTEIYGIDKSRLYVTVFGGDKKENLQRDEEAASIWESHVDSDKILDFGKKDNFWEMGETGPCGPCSEIHIDLRSEEEIKAVPGKDLVNKDHPQVIEIWNLVFIQYNRKADASLENLPEKHVDTGMGFERLSMVLQGKKSNYETDIFTPLIKFVEKETGFKYNNTYDMAAKSDISFRVLVDHIRAVAFTIADGEMPGNTGAGYVIRRILRRAVRYYYSFLGRKEPLLYKMVDILAEYFLNVFPELSLQREFISEVIREEEKSFLSTLESGLKRLENVRPENGMISGKDVFELYDTYGFPIDLTRLVASEKGLKIDESGFEIALQEQKTRSREDAKVQRGDWINLKPESEIEFVGYDLHKIENTFVVKYRQVNQKDKNVYQVVLQQTPFYPEGGGQVGDTGLLLFGEESVRVENTIKENDLIIHIVNKLPENIEGYVTAIIDSKRRRLIENNHTATHLLQAALKKVLGDHVQQRGSLVNEKYLRFDFSHFKKLSDEEIAKVEEIVNAKIRENVSRKEDRSIEIEKAKESGAMMLFGEKYGEKVRMITFDDNYSIELCGGCHVSATGKIGFFKIISETGIAAGVRRIEALTSIEAENYIKRELEELKEVRSLFKNTQNVSKSVYSVLMENKELKKALDKMKIEQASGLKDKLKNNLEEINGVNVIRAIVPLDDSKAVKTLAYNLEEELGNAVIAFAFEVNQRPQLMITVSKSLTEKGLNAGAIIREIAKEIKGGGGGQPFFATAGGKDVTGLQKALDKLNEVL